MIIYFSSIRLLIIGLFVILFPIVQKQWFNLYLFDENNSSFYSTLYYLSGLLCPILVCVNSIKKFTYYKFYTNNIKNKNSLKGRSLLLITTLTLITFSSLIANYTFINLDFIFQSIFKKNYLLNIDIDIKIFLILIFSIFLSFNKTKVLTKKFILINFFIISIFIWFLQVNDSLTESNLIITNYLNVANINKINILFFLCMETLYYFWSYISYKTNLSDWSVPIPLKIDILPIVKVIIFYLFILLYYSILQ